MIPTTGGHVDLSLLHPRFAHRLEQFLGDGRISGRVAVVSACRSYAQQKKLYDKYKAGRGNLAANPDWVRPDGFFRGSFHQQQPDGWCYAADVKITKWNGVSRKSVADVARHYGLRQTVPSEWWHLQPRNSGGWFPCYAYPDGRNADAVMDWNAVAEAVADVGRQIAWTGLRRGARGPAVMVVQRRLNELDFDCGPADGVFGRKTKRAVRSFQRVCLLDVDGVVGPRTWMAMWRPEVPSGV